MLAGSPWLAWPDVMAGPAAPPEPLAIRVCRVSGDRLELEVQQQARAGDLKPLIFERWQVPPPFQRLVYEDLPLPDAAALADLKLDPEAWVTMLVSVEDAAERLRHPEAVERIRALASFGDLGHLGGDCALAAVGSCLGDASEEVRSSAAIVLPLLAPRGDGRILESMASCLRSDASSVRIGALQVLAQSVEFGDERAIAAVLPHVDDPHPAMRRKALEVLAQLVEKGDERAVTAAAVRLADEDRGVRHVALKALGHLAEGCHPGVEKSLLRCLEDEDEYIRREALQTLCQLAEPGDRLVMAAVRARLDDAVPRCEAGCGSGPCVSFEAGLGSSSAAVMPKHQRVVVAVANTHPQQDGWP